MARDDGRGHGVGAVTATMPGNNALPRVEGPTVTWFPGLWVRALWRSNTPDVPMITIVRPDGTTYEMFPAYLSGTVADVEWDHNSKVIWAYAAAGYFPSLTLGFEGVQNLASPLTLPSPLARYIAFQWGGDYMYALADLNSPSDHQVWLVRYDRVTGAYVDQLQVVNYANRFEWDRGRYLWILGGASVQRVDLFTMTVDSTWNTGSLVLDIGYSGPVHGMMMILVQNPGTGDCFVLAIDAEGEEQGSWQVDRYSYALCTDMDHRVFIAESRGWLIQRIDLNVPALTTVQVYPTPYNNELWDVCKGIAYDIRGAQVWMATRQWNEIVAIDPATLATNHTTTLNVTAMNTIFGMSWVGGSSDAGAP